MTAPNAAGGRRAEQTIARNLTEPPGSQSLGRRPEARGPDFLVPRLELRPIPLEGLGQRVARIPAERVRHPLPEPLGLEEPVSQAAQALALNVADQLVTDVIGLPPAMTHDDGEGADVVCAAATEAELVRAGRSGAEHGAGLGLHRAERSLNVFERVSIERQSLGAP